MDTQLSKWRLRVHGSTWLQPCSIYVHEKFVNYIWGSCMFLFYTNLYFFCFLFYPYLTITWCARLWMLPPWYVSPSCGRNWSEKAVFTKRFRVSSTNRSMDSMPGTPATFTSYCDPASPNPVNVINPSQSRSNSLGGAARMDMELHGSGGNSNDSDDISGGAVTKVVPKL